MKSTLRIFDVSQYIAAGRESVVCNIGVIESSKNYAAKDMVVGGISLLLKVVKQFHNDYTDLVFCFDSPPTIKRDMHSKLFPDLGGYKGKRTPAASYIRYERMLAYDVLSHMGFNCFKADDYEADDLIYSVCKRYHDSYENIYVHNRDSDLFFLIDDKVSMTKVHNNGRDINIDNYSYSISTQYDLDYNTVLLNKLFSGDVSDNIPKLPTSKANQIMDFIPKEAYPHLGDLRVFKNMIKLATNNDVETMSYVDLYLPFYVDNSHTEIHDVNLDWNLYDYYLYMLSDTKMFYVPEENLVAKQIIIDVIEEYVSEVIIYGFT